MSKQKMTDLRKAAEMALNAMLDIPMAERPKAQVKAIQALRQALAQPEQEPFIYVREDNERPFGGYEHCSEVDAGAFPVYTAPPKREWVGLTDEEIGETYRAGWSNNVDFARAIEAKLKEKNT